jgi:hypothetical protein
VGELERVVAEAAEEVGELFVFVDEGEEEHLAS